MPTSIYFILIYVLIAAFAVAAFSLISKALTLFFDVKMYQAKSLSHPIIKGLTVILIVYTARNYLAGPLIVSVISFLNEKFKTSIPLPNLEQSTAGTIEAIILYAIVGIMTCVYIFVVYTKKEVLLEKTKIAEAEKQKIQIEFPTDPFPPSPIFNERVKQLFELKFTKENLILKYDIELKVLYGIHEYGLHKYCKIIYCDSTINPKSITAQDVLKTLNNLESNLAIQNLTIGAKIIDYYYLLEMGNFEKNKFPIQCYTEDGFTNELIDFNRYLQKLIFNFKNDKLPFSYADSEDDKYSLSQTFISPKFTISKHTRKESLQSYINSWLTQDNHKHLVVLGDYGMGKSTFMKFYACHLATQILNQKKVIRYPIFISLTNNSPRHGGIDNAIGKFISDNLGVNISVFTELVNRGKIVFLLDGFDEMGYVGTHDQRVKQLNAIWQLATAKNKLIISGRASYFPTDQELIESFNIVEIEGQYTPPNKPYFERIELEEFDNDQIKKSISIYNYSQADNEKYLDFIFKKENIFV